MLFRSMDLSPKDILRFYCNRGTMENFIKESKNGFDFASTSSHSKVVNANRLQLHVLAYNIFNWFKRLVLPVHMRKMQIDTIRLKLIKIASRVIRSARYITFNFAVVVLIRRGFIKPPTTLGSYQSWNSN